MAGITTNKTTLLLEIPGACQEILDTIRTTLLSHGSQSESHKLGT